MIKFVIYKDEAGDWRWRLVAANGEIVADSAEGYDSADNAKRAIETMRELALEAEVTTP